jgi:hypothetical protein
MCEGGGVLGCPSPTQPSPTPRPAVCVRAGRRHHAATRGQAFVRGPVHRLLRRRGRCCCCCSSSSRPLPITPSLSIPPSLPPSSRAGARAAHGYCARPPSTRQGSGLPPPPRGVGAVRAKAWRRPRPRPFPPLPWSCPGTLRVEGRSVPLFLPAVHGPDLEAYPPTVRVRGSRSGVLVPSLFLAGTGSHASPLLPFRSRRRGQETRGTLRQCVCVGRALLRGWPRGSRRRRRRR